MKTDPVVPSETAVPVTAPSPGGPVRAWVKFWFTPADPIGLHALRVLAGLLFLGWLLAFVGHQEAFFGLRGWFDRQAFEEAARLSEGAPARPGWSFLFLKVGDLGYLASSPWLLNLAYWLSLVVLALFTLGVWVRVTAVLAWVIVVSFIMNPAISYDADILLGILAFYLMIGYLFLGQWDNGRSLTYRLLGPRDASLLAPLFSGNAGRRQPSHAANLAVRLLQVHFALIVLVSALHKLQYADWWAGVAFWYPLHRPLETTAASIRELAPRATSYLFFLGLAQYAVLAWQIGFPAFAWRKRWRPVLLGGALVGWAGSVFLWREPLIGPVLLIGSLSYLTADEWQGLLRRLTELARLPGRLLQPSPAAQASAGVKG